ncbi:RHS repeat-associated core domain-containing protein [Paraburkholderia rhizosphaerae]|uniref:RHS repeat-associated core domain-containing protein n=1 Tax=Paraburkholderia rhizosphaerae TaxID=480658 RepID=UPI0035F049EF
MTFDNSRLQLVLTDGRMINLRQDPTTLAIVPDTVYIKDLILQKSSDPDGYLIKYKNGITETLTKIGVGYYVTQILHENGYKLFLEYGDSYDRAALTRVYDESGTNLIDITRTNTTDEATGRASRTCVIELYKDNADFASQMTLAISDDASTGLCLRTCNVALTESDTIETLSFSYLSPDATIGFRVISAVASNFAGPALEQIFYQDSLKLPDGFPWTTFPVVNSYTLSMTSAGTGQSKYEVHTYKYGDDTPEKEEDKDFNNFLGYQKDARWDPVALDNLYRRETTYQYRTTETLDIDGTTASTTVRVYDRYHRLYSEETSVPDTARITGRKIKVDYYYPGLTSTEYFSLPPQYKLPNRIYTKFSETTTVSSGKSKTDERTTDQYFSYDEYGNQLQEIQSGGLTVDYTYYPAAGESGSCPAEPNGFVRFLKTSKKYKTSETADCITTTRTYTPTSMKEGSSYTVLAIEEEKRIIASAESSDFKKTQFDYFNAESDTGIERGRLKSRLLMLSNGTGVTTSYVYALSAGDTRLDIATTETGVDGSTLTERTAISRLTGLPAELIDNLGVSTTLAYDKFGRVISHKRAPGTAFERTVTYGYAFDATSKLHSNTTAEPSVNSVKVTTDALGNVVKKEVGDKIAHTAEYNTQGWLVAEHRYDYEVPAADGTTTATLDLANTYGYDGFGELTQAIYHDNRENRRHFNIGSAVLTEYTNVPVKREPADVVKRYNFTRTSHDPGTLLPTTVTEYGISDKTRISTTTYSYDEFFRLRETTVVDAATQKQTHVELGYDFFDRIASVTDYDDNSQPARVTGLKYWEYGLEPQIASVSVDNRTVATRSFDGVGRLTQVDRNPDNAGESVTVYTYSSGYVTPATETTPRGVAIAHEYCAELGGVPTKTTPPSDKGASLAYEYDKDTVKLVTQTYTLAGVTETRTLTYDSNALPGSETSSLNRSDGISVTCANTFTRCALGMVTSITASASSYPNDEASYRYDSAGRVAAITFLNGGAQALKITMDYVGGELLKSATYEFGPAGAPTATFRMDVSYDTKMRLTKKTYLRMGADGAFAECASGEILYNGLNQVNEQRVGAAVVTTVLQNQYDYAGRLTDSKATDATTVYPKDPGGNNVSAFTFGYDKYNNMTSWSTTVKETGEVTSGACSYDGKNVFELTKQTITRGSAAPKQVEITYDLSGNVARVTGADGVVATCTYDCYEKLRAHTRSKPSDPNWREPKVYFAYNSQGKLRSEKMTIKEGDTLSTLRPTAFGYCDGHFIASLRKQAAGDADVQFASYLSGASSVDAIQCARGSAGSYTKSSQMLFSDPSGSVYGSVDPVAGTNIEPAIYSPYGYVGGAFDWSYDPVRFKGQRYDPLTYLYHLGDGMRAYDSALLMRFLQYDAQSPFGAGGLNPYVYCECDPVTFLDASGNNKTWVIAPVVAAIGFLLGLASFGIGAWAVAGGALALTSGLAFTGGVVGLAGGATGLGAALVEDEKTAGQLTLASSVLSGLSGVVQLLSLGFVLGKGMLAWRFVDRVSTARTLSAQAQFKRYPGTDFQVSSARVQVPGIEGNVRIVSTHGKPGWLQFPVAANANGVTRFEASNLTSRAFGFQLNRLLAREFRDTDGPILLIACGGTRAGAINNARAVAAFSNRTVTAFPSSTVRAHWGTVPNAPAQSNVTTYGWRWFPKAMTFGAA